MKKQQLKIEILPVKERLSYIPFNRDLESNKELRASIKRYGFIDSIKVVVTSLFGVRNQKCIIDGHHRYQEGKVLEMDIPYTVVLRTEELKDIVQMMSAYNSTSRVWSLDDYAKCFVYMGLPEYRYLQTMRVDTGLSYGILCRLYQPNVTSTDSFKNGNLKINKETGDKLVSYVKDMYKITEMPERSIRGFIKFCNSITDYDHKRFMRRLAEHLPELAACREDKQFQDVFRKIYNPAKVRA